MPYTRAEADRNDRSVTYCDVLGHCTVHRGGDPAWRNNNPGNIISMGGFARSHGAIGDDGTFAICPDPETGRRAMERLLRGQEYQKLTVGDAIKRWSSGIKPTAAENKAELKSYQRNVQHWTGISLDLPMSELSQQQIRQMMKAMERQEGQAVGTVKRLPREPR